MDEREKKDNSSVRCPFHDCYNCCLETQMLLTQEDLNRIESLGYSRKEFCLDPKETDGFWQLRNIKGRCFFLTQDGKCSIYESRPAGCKVYPLVFELSENDVIIDEDCRETEWFANEEYSKRQIRRVKRLANRLLDEQETEKEV